MTFVGGVGGRSLATTLLHLSIPPSPPGGKSVEENEATLISHTSVLVLLPMDRQTGRPI